MRLQLPYLSIVSHLHAQFATCPVIRHVRTLDEHRTSLTCIVKGFYIQQTGTVWFGTVSEFTTGCAAKGDSNSRIDQGRNTVQQLDYTSRSTAHRLLHDLTGQFGELTAMRILGWPVDALAG